MLRKTKVELVMNGVPKECPEVLVIGNEEIRHGERKKIYLDVASLFDYTKLNIPIEVIRGVKPGPILFISAAIHGDEINGVEIIKRILKRPSLNKIRGTLILIPVVNVFGFNNKSRYLPDRRDLNRCFPGHDRGSLGALLANIFMKEIVSKCTHGIDLHTGAISRTNLPQIRACLEDKETSDLAKCFGVPVIIHSKLRDGSLREAAREENVCSLLFEGGEALRFEENVIRSGLNGCLSVMRHIGMIPKTKKFLEKSNAVYISKGSYWVRASHSGSFLAKKKIGDHVKEGDILAIISDTFGENKHSIRARDGGIVIGMSTIPLVNRGDAMVHIATFKNSEKVKEAMELYDEDIM